MTRVTFDVSDNLLLALKLTPDRFGEELRMAAATKFVETGRLSFGAAARLAGVPVPVLLERLPAYGATTFGQSEAELREDIDRA